MFFHVPVKAVVFAVGKTVEAVIGFAKISAGDPVVFTDALVNRRLLPAIVPFEATLPVVVFQATVYVPTAW